MNHKRGYHRTYASWRTSISIKCRCTWQELAPIQAIENLFAFSTSPNRKLHTKTKPAQSLRASCNIPNPGPIFFKPLKNAARICPRPLKPKYKDTYLRHGKTGSRRTESLPRHWTNQGPSWMPKLSSIEMSRFEILAALLSSGRIGGGGWRSWRHWDRRLRW
jgi:hypothetical protein